VTDTSNVADDQHLLSKPTKVWILRVAKVIVWIVYLFVLVALILLLIAFFLRLFGADPSAGFTDWIYRSVDEIMEPFRGIFPSEQLTDRSVLDFSLLFAVIVYAIFALIVHGIVDWVSNRLARLTAPPAQAPQQPQPQYIVVSAPPTAPVGPPVATTNINVGSNPSDVVLPAPPAPPTAPPVESPVQPGAWPPAPES
jgi:uncharacterized protein YggT (Ycf19 family)